MLGNLLRLQQGSTKVRTWNRSLQRR